MFVRRLNNQSNRTAAAGWEDMRAHNTALLLGEIWSHEGLSRADLARSTGLSRATVSDIVGGFVELGVVTEAEATASSGGRPPIRLVFNDAWRQVIGVELGGAHVSGVRTDLRGKVLARFGRELPVDRDPYATLATMDDGIRSLLAADPSPPILGIGLGVPSPLRVDRGAELDVHLFPRWVGIDLEKHLHQQFGRPVMVENDANLGALAEHWWGAGRDVSDLAYIKLGTGVGAGILIGGQIHRGSSGIAGEIGHTTIDPSGPRCRCGLHGCLEALVGTASLTSRAEAAYAAVGCPRDGLTVHGLIGAAREGDTIACQFVTSAGTCLGIAVANLLNLVNPGRVILGGRLTEAGPLLLDDLLTAMEARALWTSRADSNVVFSDLGDDGVALGASTLVLQNALSNPMRFLWPDGAGRAVNALPAATLGGPRA